MIGFTGFSFLYFPARESILDSVGFMTIVPLETEMTACMGLSSFNFLRIATGIWTCHLEVILTVCIVLLILSQYKIFCKETYPCTSPDVHRDGTGFRSNRVNTDSEDATGVRAKLHCGLLRTIGRGLVIASREKRIPCTPTPLALMPRKGK